jgi:hypothetical protein
MPKDSLKNDTGLHLALKRAVKPGSWMNGTASLNKKRKISATIMMLVDAALTKI